MTTTLRAIGYIRVSTDQQSREGISLEAQKAKIETYCSLKDFELVDTIEDAGISAKNLKRPGVQRVLDMSRRHEIDAVIVYKLDRMFRSTVDALETSRQLDKWGVALHSIEESLDTRSAMGSFFFTLTAALAEMERRLIGERTRAALRHKRANGGKTGGEIPFGFDVKDGQLVENPQEQEIIQHIKFMGSQKYSLRVICAELDMRGIETKTGSEHWHPSTVRQIIRREGKT